MVVINELKTHITTNVPMCPELTGYQLDRRTFIAFGRVQGSSVFAYQKFSFNDGAVNGHIAQATMLKTEVVNPDGFVHNDIEYRIEV